MSLAYDLCDAKDRQDYIQVMLRRHGVTVAELAAELSVAKSMVGAVIASQKTSARLREAIATRIGVEADLLWPDSVEEPSGM